MSEQVIVTLPDELLQRAQVWANQTGRPLEDFLAESIEASLGPFGESPIPADHWSDEDVLATLDFELPREDDERLTQLLNQQRGDSLSEQDAVELRRLMTVYQERLLRKAVALREAVRRGLRSAPAP